MSVTELCWTDLPKGRAVRFSISCAKRALDVDVNYPYLNGSVIMYVRLPIGLVWGSQDRKDTTSVELSPAIDLILV